jgi:putative ABC transport system ATP-binding protein
VVLKTVGLVMTYPMGRSTVRALRGVDLEIEEGEVAGIMGPSGCGKSTFLHIVGGLLTPTSGQVLIDGSDLTTMSDAERTDLRRRKIGFVFQRFNLFPTLSVEGNLRLAQRIYAGAGREARTAVDPAYREEVLRVLGLQDRLGHRPTELSAGEQQRVALARAIIHRPAMLLADEPTGNLDSETSDTVLRMIRGVHDAFGQTVVLITHNPDAAAIADRVIRMKDGRVVD